MEQSITLAALAGSILSLILEYVPFVNEWYAARSIPAKKQIMGLLLIIAAVGAFLVGCYAPFAVASCTEAGAWELVGALVIALLAGTATNQTTHAITKKTK